MADFDNSFLIKRSKDAGGNNGLPEAKYTKISETFLHAIPGPLQCSVACGGKNCKWENPHRWPEKDQAIKGVYSSWVLDNVVAMSRPSTHVIGKYKMMQQFKDHNIKSIINLQRPGEHASCGPPLHKESLFTYNPKTFMDEDIYFYNFGWKDFGVTSLETILDMVKVMSFAILEGKIAIHCHAGLGRTGVLIACYLVYAHRMDAYSAITTVRKNRQNAIQTRSQLECVQQFALFMKPMRIIFPQVVPKSSKLTLQQFLRRQSHLLHGMEARELKHLPKLVMVICDRLTQIATTTPEPHSRMKRKEMEQIRRCHTMDLDLLKNYAPRAFINDGAHKDDLNSAISQSVDAVLSPRITRRKSTSNIDYDKIIDFDSLKIDKKLTKQENVLHAITSVPVIKSDHTYSDHEDYDITIDQPEPCELNLNNNNQSMESVYFVTSGLPQEDNDRLPVIQTNDESESVKVDDNSDSWVNVINNIEGDTSHGKTYTQNNVAKSKNQAGDMQIPHEFNMVVTPATPSPHEVSAHRDNDVEIIEMEETINRKSAAAIKRTNHLSNEDSKLVDTATTNTRVQSGLIYRAEFSHQIMDCDDKSETSSMSVENENDVHVEQKETDVVKSTTIKNLTRSMIDLHSYYDEPDFALPTCNSSEDIYTTSSNCSSATKHRIKDPISVAMALSYKLTSDEWLWEKVYTKQVDLNTRESSMNDLRSENDCHLLSCLLWSWIEHLASPILTSQSLQCFDDEEQDFELYLQKQDRAIFSTLDCVLSCLITLPHLTDELETSVITRIVSAFTHDKTNRNITNNLVSAINKYVASKKIRE